MNQNMAHNKSNSLKPLPFQYRHGGWKGSYLESVSFLSTPSSRPMSRIDRPIPRAGISENIKRQLQNLFETNFLGAENEYQRAFRDLASREQFFSVGAEFAQRWLKESFGVALDFEQASAVGSIGYDTQVIARAGSGKTTTLINRTLFLLKHCGIASHEILLLAFNRKAALEIRRRLLALLCDGAEGSNCR
jgi:hypothetical protein